MDAFYASVEQLDDPRLRGKPVLVGGDSPRAVVAAASYEARRFGVYSAMPMGQAKRRCPHAVIVPVRMARYMEVSREVFSVFRNYTPLVEGLSIDEAFVDVTASGALFGNGATIASRIKLDVFESTGLRVSAGVSTSKFVSKIASDLEKPDGLVVVPPGTEREFLASLPVERMWGVGKVAAEKVHRLGIRSFRDLQQANVPLLERSLGTWGAEIVRLAHGIDSREVVSHRAPKSIGAEETFDVDLTRVQKVRARLLSQSARVADRMERQGYVGFVVATKLKYADFTVKTRQLRVPTPIRDTDSIYDAACALLERFPRNPLGVRLTGVSVSELHHHAPMGELFVDARREKRDRVQATVSALRDRFGESGVTRATLLTRQGKR